MPLSTAEAAASRRVETPDYAGMMRRMMRAWGRRVVDADVEDLAELIAFRSELDRVTGETVARMRLDQGLSWAEVAKAAGTSRQAAYERWSSYETAHRLS